MLELFKAKKYLPEEDKTNGRKLIHINDIEAYLHAVIKLFFPCRSLILLIISRKYRLSCFYALLAGIIIIIIFIYSTLCTQHHHNIRE